MTLLTLSAAISTAFNFVAKQTGVEQTDREMLACERGILLYAGQSWGQGACYTATRDKTDWNAMVITYHNEASVNDRFNTVVFLNEDNLITWEN